MGARKKDSIQKVLQLSIPERILAVEAIWDSIASHPESVPLTQAQKAELANRLENPSPVAGSWTQVKKRIQAKSKR